VAPIPRARPSAKIDLSSLKKDFRRGAVLSAFGKQARIYANKNRLIRLRGRPWSYREFFPQSVTQGVERGGGREAERYSTTIVGRVNERLPQKSRPHHKAQEKGGWREERGSIFQERHKRSLVPGGRDYHLEAHIIAGPTIAGSGRSEPVEQVKGGAE